MCVSEPLRMQCTQTLSTAYLIKGSSSGPSFATQASPSVKGRCGDPSTSPTARPCRRPPWRNSDPRLTRWCTMRRCVSLHPRQRLGRRAAELRPSRVLCPVFPSPPLEDAPVHLGQPPRSPPDRGGRGCKFHPSHGLQCLLAFLTPDRSIPVPDSNGGAGEGLSCGHNIGSTGQRTGGSSGHQQGYTNRLKGD